MKGRSSAALMPASAQRVNQYGSKRKYPPPDTGTRTPSTRLVDSGNSTIDRPFGACTVPGLVEAPGMPYRSWAIGKMLESYSKPSSHRMSNAQRDRLVIE